MNNEELRQIEPTGGSEPPLSDIAPPVPADKWQMPKPVFRKTSGYLPQGFEKQFPRSDGNGAAEAAADGFPAAVPAAAAPAPAAVLSPPAVDIEPQPDISEQFVLKEIAPQAVSEPKSSGMGLWFAAAVFVAIAVFVTIFLALVWYLFLRPADGGNF